MQTDIPLLFSSQGPLARLDPGFEERPQQAAMASAVLDALVSGKNLAVEAGTGVGKSLGYLLPGGLWALGEDRRLLVATYTRALQEQLMHRELPLAAAVLGSMGLRLEYAMLQGSDNYLCVRRLARQRRQPDLFDRGGSAGVLSAIAEWTAGSSTGHRSSLPVLVPEGLWQRLCRDPEACMGSSCRSREDCLYRKDWAKAESSRVLVVNHALLLSSPRLPAFGGLVVDEAHSLEDAAVSHFGLAVSDLRCSRVLADISSHDGRHGVLGKLAWLKTSERSQLEGILDDCRSGSRKFFSDLASLHGLEPPAAAGRAAGGPDEPQARRLHPKHGLKAMPALRALESALAGLADSCADPEEAAELKSGLTRLAKLRHDIDAVLKIGEASVARWVESGKGRVSLHAAPLELSPLLERALFSKDIPVVMTSATLSCGRGLTEFKSRVGASGASELVLDSPFDYPTQAGLLLVDHLPEPGRDGGYETAVADACRKIIAAVPGGLFLLFSSWRVLRGVAGLLRGKVKGRPLWSQGESGNEDLLAHFMAERNAVLLGVDTFWQGVDVQGGALKCVVLTKLPFPNFATPLEEARREYLESMGRSYFEDYSVPKAVVKFRQGFGRLIRSCDDRGAVVVLDPRILHRGYGRLFLEALPRCRRLRSFADLKAFFKP